MTQQQGAAQLAREQRGQQHWAEEPPRYTRLAFSPPSATQRHRLRPRPTRPDSSWAARHPSQDHHTHTTRKTRMSTHGIQRVVDLFWSRPEQNTDTHSPITVLGRRYTSHIRQQAWGDAPGSPVEEEENDSTKELSIADISVSDIKNYFSGFAISKHDKKEDTPAWPDDFMSDVYSRIWLTYRTKFPPLHRDEDGPSPLSLQNLIRGQNYQLNGDFFTTDCGWGCMIRTGQTMLANALLNLILGRDWRFDPSSTQGVPKHDEIVSWFADVPSMPFSIHNIVQKGRELSGKKAGEWFGPSAAARSIQALSTEFDTGLKVYIGADSGDVYEQDVFKVSGGSGDEFQPTLILLGVRLGVDQVNKVYWQSLKDILSSSESVGIAGGRPSSSHYFFGFQGDYLFYLDPHIPQPALKETELGSSGSESAEVVSKLDVHSVHTDKIRRIHLAELDPSMLLGFLIKDGDEWDAWKQSIQDPENKNTIVHISPDENPVSLTSFRKASFVLVNDCDGDDFIDVGLEYDDIPEEENPNSAGTETLPTVASDSTTKLSEGTAEKGDESLVIVTEPPKADFPEEDIARSSVISRDTTASFENYSGSIKDDYENIGTAPTEKFDPSNTVEVDVSQFEDPFVVVKEETDINIEEDVATTQAESKQAATE